ncbi:putative dienelactone hydrolase [Roseibium hamelinense]|uniref:Putative dienelactone hydrolase n=1 Tax=Roseibium hamelinense TaxID=150831 RepID=A0A562T7B6_9HYPH|nr:alpha/beta fold hydrolase [Roseibium hamelinense]MTI42802.1 alpha/beta fold hydrolase [Roseibium hamelinense]TWI89467.1 putative dienelactone hydrolase [Roseibium hamelinense]
MIFQDAVPTAALRAVKGACIAPILACTLVTSAFGADLAGYDRFDFKADHRAGLVQASLWYPAGTSTYAAPVGDGPVFQPARALIGAAIKPGHYPLVVLSHGSGGNMDGLGWLSSELAKDGAMVLAVNHPGSTSGDSSPRRSARFAERVWDLSAALDHVLATPDFVQHVDRDRIYALGFSLGGTTVLQGMGLEFRAKRLGDYCAENAEAPGCDFYGSGGVDFRKADFDLTDGNYRDTRYAGTIAVDPGFPFGFTEESIASMDKPALLINLGSQETIWWAVNVGDKGARLAEKLPNAEFVEISPATHFSFLAECKEAGPQILRAEQDDPVCDEPQGVDRVDVHRRAVDAVSRFLAQAAP